MAALSDGTLRRLLADGRVKIDPYDEAMVQPASIDLRLGPSFRVFHNFRVESIDIADPPQGLTEHVEIDDETPFVVHPGEFVLGRTAEYVEMPDDLVARVEGKSSLGRLGLIVHATAGFCDPGWNGTLTLELNNLTRVPIRLYPQAKDVFFTLVGSTYRFIRGAGGAVESVSVLGVGSSELRGRRLHP